MNRFIAAGAAALLALALGAPGAQAEPVTAKTSRGVLVGELKDGIASFKGVPYAAPPVGELRWQPPQPGVRWEGLREAVSPGPACMQPRAAYKSEDCLYLNIYAPENAKNLPVMVWIHGGSNVSGQGATYNGAAFAKDGVVHVSINYRMGALGFFAHPAITKAAPAAQGLANYGLLDQTAALIWVRNNIAAFGGDPKRVTVFGESAGAIDIYALLGAPQARDLFSQAIIQSNITWGNSASLAEAEKDGVETAMRAGAPANATLQDLLALPADKLIAAQSGSKFPIVDGRFLVETPLQAVAGGRAVDVPLIIGSNSYEASLIAARNRPAENETAEQAAARRQRNVDYTNSQAGAPARFIAAKTAGGAPSWLYFFSYLPTERRTPDANGAAHASEINYVYGGSMRRAGVAVPEGETATAPPASRSEEDKAMADLMHACWVAFAKTGKPTCGNTAWPAYTPAGDQLMEFGSPVAVRSNFRKAEYDRFQAAEKDAK